MNARDLMYSTTEEESGSFCGKMQTVFFKLPGKQATGPAGWQIRAKLSLYVWLGIVKHKKFFFSGLPRGFELSQDLRNAERPRALAPTNIHYLEKHVMMLQCNCCINPNFLFFHFPPRRHFNFVLTSIKQDPLLAPMQAD